MPVAAARATLAATSSGSIGEAALEVGVDRHVDAVGDRAEVRERLVERDADCRGRPSDHAKPELVVASALKPSCASSRALPTSHGIRDDEAAVRVEVMKDAAAMGERGHVGSSPVFG